MKKSLKLFILTGMTIFYLPVCVCSAQNTEQTKGVGEMSEKAENRSTYQENLDFLMEKYDFTADELADIDLERFIEDYDLYNLDYTPEEIQQILSDERDMYIDNGVTERFKIFDQKSDDTTTPDMKITRIGYYYNEGTLFQRIVFDFQNNVWYLNENEAVHLEKDEADSLLSLDDKYHVFQWDANYEGEEEETTGSLRWKLVFEFENGSYRSFGGYTRDMSHLPDNFREVSDLIRKIIK